MYRDPRGGHNRKAFNNNFFKIWSPAMAYILGFIFADGAILDSRKSSRTCYLTITICDKDLLEQIKSAINSNHNITTLPSQQIRFGNKTYLGKTKYKLRIGSKTIFQDLINLGVTPRKSLRAKVPSVPEKFFGFFLRGYFDGDGCLNFYFKEKHLKPRIKVIFTSGSLKFLKAISFQLNKILHLKLVKEYWNSGAYRLMYTKASSIKILSYIYHDLNSAPFLERKYNKFLQALTY